MSDIQQQLDALSARVAQLEAERWSGPPRLGPRAETEQELAERSKRIADKIERIVRANDPARMVPSVDRSKLCVCGHAPHETSRCPYCECGVYAPAVAPVDRSALCTTNGQTPDEVRASQTNETGQHAGYIVLCEDERKKGFVRPYRDAYKHVGIRPKYSTRDLTLEEHERYDRFSYIAYEAYPDGSPESNEGSTPGRFWTAAHLSSGCGSVTTMGRALSETYARDPGFYGATFCVHCNRHLPVVEFVWTADGARVGS